MQWLCSDCGVELTPRCDDAELGEKGPLELECECGWSMFVPAETEARTRIDAMRKIVREHQAARVEGYLVDAFTASALVAVYDALSPKARRLFGKPPLPKLVEFCWKEVKVGES